MTSPSTDDRRGLPPVDPPSGRLLAQLFLVPGLIVAGVVLLLLFVNWMVSGPRNPESFLKRLDDPNAEVRWRAAADLSQVLLRDDHLAANPEFVFALASRLAKARDASAQAEADFASRVDRLAPEEVRKERAKLRPERNYVNYLTACLGSCSLPIGVPVLQELALQSKGMEPSALATRRRDALWALARLGDGLKRFDRLLPARRDAIVDQLDEMAIPTEQESWRQLVHRRLAALKNETKDALGVDGALLACAQDHDPVVREFAAFGMNFWHADASGEEAIETALEQLAHDSGKGEELLARWAEDDPDPNDSQPITTRPGYKVAVNANVALCRRGSARVRLGLLAEMLDEAELRKIFILRDRAGNESPDEVAVLQTLIEALKSVSILHGQRPDVLNEPIRAAIERLTNHPNVAVQHEARLTQLSLDRQ